MVPPRKPKLERAALSPPEKGEPEATSEMPRPTLWRRVAAALEADIAEGQFVEGSRLPTDVALARRFKVNRHTARRALAELSAKGLLRAQPQVGYFVAPLRLRIKVGPDSRLSETIEKAGFRPGLRIVGQGECLPPEPVAAGLRVASLTKVQELTFVRLANALPVAIVTYWLPADRFPNAGKLLANGANIRAGLARAGVRGLRRLSTRIFARPAVREEGDLLQLAAGTALLCLEVTDVDGGDEPVAVVLYRFNAARTELFM